MKRLNIIILLFISYYSALSQTTLPTGELPNSAERVATTRLPYPILFVHGTTGDETTWEKARATLASYGFIDGGILPFCLNSDDNKYKSNIFGTAPDIKAFFNINTISIGDYYTIDFNINIDGSSPEKNTTTLSNQEAITKQGLAIRFAVNHILAKTGKDRVILVGHSMGGLAAREYMQNSLLYQPDGLHHIAKLVTMATPHNGVSLNVIELLIGKWFAGADKQSNALRDLKTIGVYLNGGNEASNTGCYDKDTNCNTYIDNENITGLNQRGLPVGTVDYTCAIVGNNGDKVVTTTSAQLNNIFPTLKNETFYTLPTNSFNEHSDITKDTKLLIDCLDETEYYNKSLEIAIGKGYNAFITEQAEDAEYKGDDYDDFVFEVSKPDYYKLTALKNISTSIRYDIYAANNTTAALQSGLLSTNTQKTFPSVYLDKGVYYLEFHAAPTADTWQGGYWFAMLPSGSTVTATHDVVTPNSYVAYPNPTNRFFSLKNGPEITALMLYNSIGTPITTLLSQNGTFDLGNLPTGLYIGKTDTGESVKIIKE